MKPYPKEVIEIHNEFNTAGDKLLANALEIINKCGLSSIEKAERLKKVGFFNADDIKKVESVNDQRTLFELVNNYSIRYPDNKFITEDKVEAICKKYKLSCAPISRYKGFVPETKLLQIESFTINGNDLPEQQITNVKFLFSFADKEQQTAIKSRYPKGIYPVSEANIDSRYPSLGGASLSSYSLINNRELLICAPKKDIDLKGLKKVGAILKSFVTVTVPDPVVLQPVKGGYLIVAAWGDEASDELVVNNKFN